MSLPWPDLTTEEWETRLRAVKAKRTDLGDEPGHPFRGNQWTDGESGDTDETADKASEAATAEGPSEAFRREVGTTSAEMKAEPLPKSLDKAEDRLRDEPNEHAFVVKDGKVIAVLGDDHPDYVQLPKTITDDEVGSVTDPLRDVVFTHNHPANTAFSPDDILIAAAHNMKEVRAVVKDGTYSMKRVGDHWPSVAYLQHAAKIENANVHDAFDSRIKKHLMTVPEAIHSHWPLVWHAVVTHQRQESDPGAPTMEFSFEPKAKS